MAELKGHRGPVVYAAFSPDGSSLVTASEDNTARLWRIDGSPIATLSGHTSGVLYAAFSSNGAILATASEDTTARVWTIDGRLVAILKGHLGPVQRVAFSPDGETLLTASGDKSARLFPISERKFKERVEKVAKRCLNFDERRRAYPDETESKSATAAEACAASVR